MFISHMFKVIFFSVFLFFLSIATFSCSSFINLNLANETKENLLITIITQNKLFNSSNEKQIIYDSYFSAKLTESKYDHSIQIMSQDTGKYHGKLIPLNFTDGVIISTYDLNIKKYKTSFLLPPQLKFTLYRAIREKIISSVIPIDGLEVKGANIFIYLEGSDGIKSMVENLENCSNCTIKIGNRK